jgi:hypothetical protein
LLVPIEVISRRLQRAVQAVGEETASAVEAVREETAASVAGLTARVADFEQEVGRRLEDASLAITQRLAAEQAADVAAFDVFVNGPTRDGIIAALRRAVDLGLINGQRGPRARVDGDRDVFLRLDYEPAHESGWTGELVPDGVTLIVEDGAGHRIDATWWAPGESFEDAMVAVGRIVQRVAVAGTFDVAAGFRQLRDLLTIAYDSPERRPLLQLCPPQWAITDTGIVTVGHPTYFVPLSRLRQPETARDVGQKQWVDADSFEEAQATALELLDDGAPF